MPASTVVRKILIKIDTAGSPELRKLADQLSLLNKSTKSLSSNMSFLTGAFSTLLGYMGTREIIQVSDNMQNLTNRLKITAQEGEKVSETFQKIADLAERTNRSISDVGNVYNRFAVALSNVNPKANELIALSEGLINTFRLAGSGVAETTNTLIQLGQAFSSGEVRGQELRSVLEQNGILAGLLRKEFKNDIFGAAEKGLIKASVVTRILIEHFEELREQTKNLTPTFEETLTKAMNKVSITIDALNKKYDVAAKFAKFMGGVTENLATIISVVAVGAIATLIFWIGKLGAALLFFSLNNPITAVLTGLALTATLVYTNFDKLIIIFKEFQATAFDVAANVFEAFEPLRKTLSSLGSGIIRKGSENDVDSLREKAAALRKEVEALKKSASQKETDPLADLRNLQKRQQEAEKGGEKAKKLKEILSGINKELARGVITVEEYNKKLVAFDIKKLKQQFAEGKFDAFEFNKRLNELNLQNFNRQLRQGLITFSEFQDKVRNGNLDELNKKFEAGKITLTEYNNELIKISEKFEPGAALQSGTAAFLENIGTLSQNVAGAITATFGHLEDTLVDFTKTGELNFKKMTAAILDDLTRIIIRAAIIRPLASGVLGAAGIPPKTTGTTLAGAQGLAFYGGVRKFAKGGIVDSPTAFQYGGGKRGLMGEAGSEAIIPLQRGSNGDLGVAASVTPVTVNVINQSGSEVEQRESTGPNGEKTIDILITSRVREGILAGRFDGAMKQSYGVNRRGS